MRQAPRVTETLTRIADISREIDRLQEERDLLVAEARIERKSWFAIAEALGVSRQAAWKAHRALEADIRAIRDRSALSEAQAMALAKEVLGEVRRDRRRG